MREPEPEPESGRGLEDSARGFEAEAGTEVEEGAAKVGAFVGRGGGEDDEEEGAGGRDADFVGLVREDCDWECTSSVVVTVVVVIVVVLVKVFLTVSSSSSLRIADPFFVKERPLAATSSFSFALSFFSFAVSFFPIAPAPTAFPSRRTGARQSPRAASPLVMRS